MKKIILGLLFLIVFNPAIAQLNGGLLFPGPGLSKSSSTIGAPISLGTNSNAASATSISITSALNIVAGDTVVVTIGHLTLAGTTITGVSDGTNTYSKATSGINSTNQEAELWYCVSCSAVATPTIVATLSAASVFRVIGAARVTGVTTLDIHPAGVGSTSASPTVSTGVLAVATEIIFGFLYINNNPTVTESSGFSQIYNENSTTVTNHLGYQIVSSTSSVAYSPTESASSSNVIMVSSFK